MTDNAYEYDPTPENKARHFAAFKRIFAQRKMRYYIKFSMKGTREKAVWPLLFHSYTEAQEFTRSVEMFKNFSDAKSFTIESTQLP